MSEPALPGALSAVDRLVVSLVAGINMRALYGSEHPALAVLDQFHVPAN